MKTITFILLLALALANVCDGQPKIWSVSKNAAQKADYSEIQAAIDAASPGDYIYVYPSVYENGFTLGISLVIVGPGYFLGDNPGTQVNKSPATVKGEVTIGTNTSGTIITGLNIENTITIQSTSNIIVKRNWIKSLQIKGATGIQIKQNFINGKSLTDQLTSKDGCGNQPVNAAIHIGANSSDINLLNNFIKNGEYGSLCQPAQRAIHTVQTSFSLVKNNIIDGNLEGYNITFENNILIAGAERGLNSSSYNNNLAYNDLFGTTNGNQSNIALTTVFVGSTSNPSEDGQWQLKNGSPAKAAGLNGVDCGMFGGSDPYVLSGIPDIPAIYFFEAPDGASTTNGLPVHIKIKSRQ